MRSLNRWDFLGIGLIMSFLILLIWGPKIERMAESELLDAMLDESIDFRPGHEWLGIYRDGKRIGFVRIFKESLANGLRYEVNTELAFGDVIGLKGRFEAELEPTGELKRFDFSAAGLTGSGQVNDGRLSLTYGSGTTEHSVTFPLDGPLLYQDILGAAMSRMDLTPGQRYRLPLFRLEGGMDPNAEIEVVGPDEVAVVDLVVAATKLKITHNGMTITAWINQRGEMLRQELPWGIVVIRETEMQATARETGSALELKSYIPVPDMTEALRRSEAIQYELDGLGVDDFVLDDHRQTFREGRLTVRQDRAASGIERGTPQLSAIDLKPSHFIESDAAPIRDQALRIVSADADTLDASRQILQWMKKQMTQTASAEMPSALRVLETLKGDCKHFTALFVALARAAGVPTRMVTGLIFKDGRFAYHAWAEIQVADGWLSVDPTRYPQPVDVGYIALIRGGIDAQSALAPLWGRLTIRVVVEPPTSGAHAQ